MAEFQEVMSMFISIKTVLSLFVLCLLIGYAIGRCGR